jgi:glutamyl-tRNA reductase
MPSTRPDLHLVGINFRTAAETVREGLAFSPSQTAALLTAAREALPGVEALVLSTCNRTEFYLSGLPAEELLPGWHALLRSERSCASALEGGSARYLLHGAEAYRHLLRVVCGLDSALLGDGQVVGQVRRAVATSQEAGTLGRVLNPAFTSALTTGRRARRETSIGVGAPGVGGAVAAALASRHVGLHEPVVVLGSGEAARAVGRALAKAGHRSLVVCGRNPEATAAVAAQCGAAAATWPELQQVLAGARAVVVATAAGRPVLDAVPSGPSLVVDAGFPRQVSPAVARPGLDVVSLLALTEQADTTAEQRRAAVPEVEALVAEQVATWALAQDRAEVEAAIKALHTEAAQVTREAAVRLAAMGDLPERQVEQLLGREVRRLLHGHVSRLRALIPTPRQPTGYLTTAAVPVDELSS